jgi:hypothetical protein
MFQTASKETEMTERELLLALWESRSLRCTAESQKFHALSCANLAVGKIETYKKLAKKSNLFAKGAQKCIEKAISFGMKKL